MEGCQYINVIPKKNRRDFSLENQDLLWMARALAALANENRLSMFQHPSSKELKCNAGDGACTFPDHCGNVSELVATQGTVSYHVIELSRADLMETKRRGQFIYCYMNEFAVERLELFLRDGVLAPAATS